jgi:hypothetical protein
MTSPQRVMSVGRRGVAGLVGLVDELHIAVVMA